MESTFYEKTAAGISEISTRSQQLNFKERQLLILIDGKISVAALTQLMPLADLLLRLEKLQMAGMITCSVAKQGKKTAFTEKSLDP
ncbi:hypothetical protein [uncultured Deefgea sp.]|uniref:hypothetical protein n=1 Tax=uncultured Deefgea sp. TaxID=1304914 RepID=UPI002598B755|nr:hypothetical protein [uncultured Deefgea sp.]